MTPPVDKTVKVPFRRGQQKAAALSTQSGKCLQFLKETGGFWISPDGKDIRPAQDWKEGYVGIRVSA